MYTHLRKYGRLHFIAVKSMYVMALKGRDTNWFRRRWLDFRNGHGIYLVFIMTFANFVTIQYSLLIDKVPALNSVFNNLWAFALIFIARICAAWDDNRILA